MKIVRIEALHADGGWRPWTFVRIETNTGLVGWGECSDNRSPYGIAGSVRDLAPLLVGQDPRPVERLYWDMLRANRQNYGGVSFKAMAGIELALWDIKAKALGVPVYELFGGPMRDRMRLYWSHCGTTRARMGNMLGTPPLRTYDDIAALGREVVARGFTALKTNMVVPGDPASSRLLVHPLAPQAGGDDFHGGGRQFTSQDDPDWQILAEWVRGQKAGAPSEH